MDTPYYNAIAGHGRTLITHISLVNGSGTEVSNARLPVTWTAASDGLIRPTADLDFGVNTGVTVAGWRGHSALTGGTNYGGADLSPEVFNQAGEYRLLAASTSITHQAPA